MTYCQNFGINEIFTKDDYDLFNIQYYQVTTDHLVLNLNFNWLISLLLSIYINTKKKKKKKIKKIIIKKIIINKFL